MTTTHGVYAEALRDLADFLLARIAEDEEAAKDAALTAGWEGFGDQRVRSGEHWTSSYHVVKLPEPLPDSAPDWVLQRGVTVADCGALRLDLAAHIARWDPDRVLAECEAKREIVEEFARLRQLSIEDEVAREEAETHHPVSAQWRELAERDLMVSREVLAAVCRLLARPYADHPDYRADDWRPTLYTH